MLDVVNLGPHQWEWYVFPTTPSKLVIGSDIETTSLCWTVQPVQMGNRVLCAMKSAGARAHTVSIVDTS